MLIFTSLLICMCFHVINFCLLNSAWRSVIISCKAGLVVINSLNFCLFGQVFISLLCLKDNMPGEVFLAGSFFFQHLNICNPLLSCSARSLIKKLTDSIMGIALCQRNFSLAFIKSLFLRFYLHSPVLLRYNLNTSLYKITMYDIMVWITYNVKWLWW